MFNLKPIQKLLMCMCFCFLDGMIIGSACTAFDNHDMKFGIVMLIGGLVALGCTIGYAVCTFKTIHVEDELEHRCKQSINMSHVD